MINYSRSFYERFGYEKEDADYLIDQLALIENSEAKATWNALVDDYENGVERSFDEYLEGAKKCGETVGMHAYTAEFLMLVCLARGAERLYEKKGISAEIFENSFLDIKYKLEECKLVKGIRGTFVGFWFGGWYDLTRFALGRLQFELVDCGFDYEKDGKSIKKGDKIINVHIPRTGTPFTPEACDESFERAANWFRDQIEGDIAIMCHSWLLYPPLKDELSDKMNTKKFADRFDIISVVNGEENDHGESWRLFDHDYNGDPNSLEPNTGLRAAYVRMIKKSNISGAAEGVFFY